MAPTLEVDSIGQDTPVSATVDIKKPSVHLVEVVHETTNPNITEPTLENTKTIQQHQSHHVTPITDDNNDDGSALLTFILPPDPTLVLHASTVPTDFDALRFSAASSRQLLPATHPAQLSPWLVSSPYNAPAHLLDLRTLDLPNVLFAKALTVLKPVREDYAVAEYCESLNLGDVLRELRGLSAAAGYSWRETEFYLVVFRSRLHEGIDNEYLYQIDAMSHQEATASGGLLKYWFGKCDTERRNLATCFWRNRNDARLGGRGPWHAKARRAGRELYERIEFATYNFVVTDGAEGFRMEPYRH